MRRVLPPGGRVRTPGHRIQGALPRVGRPPPHLALTFPETCGALTDPGGVPAGLPP